MTRNHAVAPDAVPRAPLSISIRSGLKGNVFVSFMKGRGRTDVIRVENATLRSGPRTCGADIFEAIAAEDD